MKIIILFYERFVASILQEIKQLKDQLKSAQNNNMVEVQCQLAETSSDLILEVIALRAKIEEMREDSMNQERIVRDRVKSEYDELVQDMFSASFDTMQKFDKYKYVPLKYVRFFLFSKILFHIIYAIMVEM